MINARLVVSTTPDLDRPIRHLEQAVGSGKTGLVVSEIRKRSDQNFMVVTPTVQLAKEIHKRLLLKDVPGQNRRFDASFVDGIFSVNIHTIAKLRPSIVES